MRNIDTDRDKCIDGERESGREGRVCVRDREGEICGNRARKRGREGEGGRKRRWKSRGKR